MKSQLLIASFAAFATLSADAGFVGFVASARNAGGNTVIDVFAGVANASDRFLNVYNLNSDGAFVQKAGISNKTWKPDTANFNSTRSTTDDSFMTAGTFGGGAYLGEYYAASATSADPNFTGTSWNATLASAAAASIPANAGWYTGDPTATSNAAESLAGLAGRVDASTVDAAPAAQWGIWVAHLVIAGENKVIGVDFTFGGFASIKDGLNGAVSQGTSAFPVPAPGAVALLAVAGLAARRRRA
jgi:MYXO-CTERM domain-containing protein